MVWPIFKDLKQLWTFHHVTNIILCVSYYLTRVVPPFCYWLYPDSKCIIGQREYEIFLFLAVVIYVKNRKAASFLHYLSTVFLFTKLANVFMFYWANPAYAVIYGAACIVQMVMFPEPAFTGPEKVLYFRGPNLRDEIDRDKRITWLVEFYANWSPLCQQVAPVFASVSNKYALPNFQFAKLDVGRYAKEAERYNINTNPTSKQLPTIVLFHNGKEVKRRPVIDNNKRVYPFVFREENIVLEFDLNSVYEECKKTMPKKDRKDMKEKDEQKEKETTPTSGHEKAE